MRSQCVVQQRALHNDNIKRLGMSNLLTTQITKCCSRSQHEHTAPSSLMHKHAFLFFSSFSYTAHFWFRGMWKDEVSSFWFSQPCCSSMHCMLNQAQCFYWDKCCWAQTAGNMHGFCWLTHMIFLTVWRLCQYVFVRHVKFQCVSFQSMYKFGRSEDGKVYVRMKCHGIYIYARISTYP